MAWRLVVQVHDADPTVGVEGSRLLHCWFTDSEGQRMGCGYWRICEPHEDPREIAASDARAEARLYFEDAPDEFLVIVLRRGRKAWVKAAFIAAAIACLGALIASLSGMASASDAGGQAIVGPVTDGPMTWPRARVDETIRKQYTLTNPRMAELFDRCARDRILEAVPTAMRYLHNPPTTQAGTPNVARLAAERFLGGLSKSEMERGLGR